MSKLWSKGENRKSDLAKKSEAFTVGNDYLLDHELLPFDLTASMAHVRGLHHAGILSDQELHNLIECLEEIAELHASGDFQIKMEHEDGHTAIEEYLVEKLGEVGKKVHTGRSRNDQVLTALRLYEKHRISETIDITHNLARGFLDFARKHEFVPMPGFTHTQPAMVSSVGMWAGSYAELFIGNLRLMNSVLEMIDFSPLGSAAGFGVNIDLPRELTSDLLGFSAPMTTAMTAQSTRGKWEASIIHSLAAVSANLSQFASDLIQYSSKEYDFFDVHEDLTTGSSIMPQKRNQDVAELLRAKHSQIISDEFLLHNLTMRLTSGYHRDLQLTKEPVIRSFNNCIQMITISTDLISTLKVDKKKLVNKIYPEMMAADKANELVMQGIPFRDAYDQIGKNLDTLKVDDLAKILKERTHLGATGNLGLELLERQLKEFE